MKRGFALLLAAQFVSALADNAILIVAIALLDRVQAPAWMTPMLKFVFIGSFVVFAVGVGAFAETMPKARVMLITNAVKGGGSLLMLLDVHPLAAYAVIGFGAAAYSPAKYGLLIELLPADRLVVANAWLEGLTIASVILGTVVGGALVSPEFALLLGIPAAADAALSGAIAVALGLYVAAALINLFLPASGRRYSNPPSRFSELVQAFAAAFAALVADPAGRIALMVTSLLWGVGATLQFVVIDWARTALQLPLDRAALLPGLVAVGVAIGAIVAARTVPLARTFTILPVGVVFGPLVIGLLPVTSLPIVCVLLLLMGVTAGFFLVPLNAMLQYRGFVLTNAGQTIAVQNFCENLSVMTMVAVYATLLGTGIPLSTIVIALGLFVSLAMFAVQRHSQRSAAATANGGARPR